MAGYKYVLDETGQWHRVSNSEEGRVFLGLTVTPEKVKHKHIPKKIDNSLETAKKRDKWLLTHNEDGTLKYEKGLEQTSPEFDLITLGSLFKTPVKKGIERLKELRSYYLFPRKKLFELQAFTPQYDPFGIFKDNGELNYHMQRLINGGLDKLKLQGLAAYEVKIFDIDKSLSNFNDIYQLAISRSPGMEGKEIYDVLRQGILRIADNNIAVSIGDHNGNALGIIVKAKNIPNSGNTISHELDHALHRPANPPEGFDFSGSLYKDYFLNKNGTELSARGTLVKDYFRITDPNEPITEDMLKTASLVYIKDTGINNMMSEFFKGISDYKKAAKWLSDNSTVISVPFLFSLSIIGPLGDAWLYLDRYNNYIKK